LVYYTPRALYNQYLICPGIKLPPLLHIPDEEQVWIKKDRYSVVEPASL
jgi:hypothetical protein